MIIQPADTGIFAEFVARDATGEPMALAWNTAGLVAEYRHSDDDDWTPIVLQAGTLGTWLAGGLADAGEGNIQLGLPDAAIPPSPALFGYTVVRLRGVAGMRCNPVRVDFRGLPLAKAGFAGGLLTAVNLPFGAGVGIAQKVNDFSDPALTTLWNFVPAGGLAGMNAAGVYRKILDGLSWIKNKVAAIGVASWWSLSGKPKGPFRVRIGDAFNATTGNRIKFSFVGWQSIAGKTISGELRYKNGETIATLAGSVLTSSADPTDVQEATVDIDPDTYNDLWLPSREGREHEMLCKVDYGGGNLSTVGETDVVLLRG